MATIKDEVPDNVRGTYADPRFAKSATEAFFGREKDVPIRIILDVQGGEAVIRADKGADVTVVPLKLLVEEAKIQLEWAVKRAVPQ